jgi:hypothetical protein
VKNIIYLLFIFVFFNSGSVLSSELNPKESSAPRFALRTGGTLTESDRQETERRYHGTTLRQGTVSLINSQGENLSKRASILFMIRLYTYVSPQIVGILPEEIIRAVPPILINKANFMDEFTASSDIASREEESVSLQGKKGSGVADTVLARPQAMNPIQVAKGFIRLGLLIKDFPHFEKKLKDNLMKLSFIKARDYGVMVVSEVEDSFKCDLLTSIGQCTRWAAAREKDRVKKTSLLEEALTHFTAAESYIAALEENDREAFSKKIMSEKVSTLALFLENILTIALMTS